MAGCVCSGGILDTQLSTHWADSNECRSGGFSSQELDKREEKVGMYPRLSAFARLNHFEMAEPGVKPGQRESLTLIMMLYYLFKKFHTFKGGDLQTWVRS